MNRLTIIIVAGLAFTAGCTTMDLSWEIPLQEDKQVELAGYLHSSDSVHCVWGAYAMKNGAVEAADLHVKVFLNGALEASATAVPSAYPYLNPAKYTFEAHFVQGDHIRIEAGETFVETEVLPPPDTVLIDLNSSAKTLLGEHVARVSARIRGGGYYRVELLIEKRWLDSSGRLVHLAYPVGPSKIFSIDDGDYVCKLDIPWTTLSTGAAHAGAKSILSIVRVRVSALSRDIFSWYNVWSSDKADNMFSRMADTAIFPGNVQGGLGLVDITSDVERVIIAKEFDLR